MAMNSCPIIASDEALSIASQLKEHGFCRLQPSKGLNALIKRFFHDICKYALIVYDDASHNSAKKILRRELTKAIEEDEPLLSSHYLNLIFMDIANTDRSLLGYIYEMGTCPSKFDSARLLASSDDIRNINNAFFGAKNLKGETTASRRTSHPLIVMPHNGETLHLFPPGDQEFKHNLPIHQDFPYLLQSQSQITYWLNLSNSITCYNGGIRLYRRTHTYQLPITTTNHLGHYEVHGLPEQDAKTVLHAHEFVDSESTLFELYAVDSLLWHQSLRSKAKDSVRMTYIFRFSDINTPDRLPFGVDTSKGNSFKDHFSNLYLEPD